MSFGSRSTQRHSERDGTRVLAAPVTSYAYNSATDLASVTTLLGTTTYAHDNLGRQTSVTEPDPDGAGSLTAPVTAFAYNALGAMTSLTDPMGNVTSWVHDGLGRVTTETNDLNKVRTQKYDAASNVIEKIDRNGRKTLYEYDHLNRRTAEIWKDGTTTIRTIAYVHDAASQLTSASDAGSSVSFTHDNLGRVLTETQAHNGLSVVLTSGYDAADNRTSLKATIGGTADFHNVYQFDALSRMVRIDQTGQTGGNTVAEKRIDLAYNAASQFTGIQRYKDTDGGSGHLVVDTALTYDSRDRLTSLTHSKDTTTFADYDWTYDAMGRVTEFSFDFLVGTDGSSSYSYDNVSQLVGADHSNQADENHSFDAAGNRTDTGYSTGDNNRMTSDGTFNYTHDDEGNRLTRTRISSASADDYLVEFTWDHRNRLTNIKFKNNAGTVTKELGYEYDPFNRRIEQSLDADGAGSGAAVVTRWVHDGEHVSLEFNGSNVLTQRFVHGPVTDQWLAVEVAATGVVYWPLADNLGSIRDIINSAGSSQNHLDYSAWGAVTAETDISFQFLFGYTGAVREEATGLNYHRARYYDAAVGEWISEDPIGFQAGDYNIGRYVGNGPTNFTDPSGLEGYWAGVGQTAKGYFWDGPIGIVVGIGSMIAHPLDTMEGLDTAVLHPILTGQAVIEHLKQQSQTLDGQGAIAFDVVSLVTPLGLAKLDKIRKAAQVARLAREAQLAAEAANLAKAAQQASSIPSRLRSALQIRTEAALQRQAGSLHPKPPICFTAGTQVADPIGVRLAATGIEHVGVNTSALEDWQWMIGATTVGIVGAVVIEKRRTKRKITNDLDALDAVF